MTELLWIATALLAVAALWAWAARRARAALLLRLRREWGSRRDVSRDMEGIADLFRSRDDGSSIDDRTWTDLLLDEVFAIVDRTESSVGQQILYRRLRRSQTPHALDAFESLVGRVTADEAFRCRAQAALARTRDPSAYYLHRLADPDILFRRPWHVVFPLWTAAVLVAFALGFVWNGFFMLAIFGAVANFGIRLMTIQRVSSEIVWFRHVGPLISAAQALAVCPSDATGALTGSMQADLIALRRIAAIARWVSRGSAGGAGMDLVSALTEYLAILLLADVNALYFAGRELQSKGPQLLRIIETVGEIDAAIAVASFRAGVLNWTRPVFAAPDARARFSELRHPVLEDAVPNSIELAPPSGVLVTGSNMSGKSTFLRTVGINVVLAQSINTCLADGYDAPVYEVRSCIGRADDLIAGKSYYLVEVESVLALLKASAAVRPQLFIFDELFRGTNAVERIAAGEAILRALVDEGKPHVVLTATHDAELVDLLRDVYAVYHLGDAIGPDGLTFDYRLTPGPATSRNAIALLKLSGAPELVVSRALERAAALDRRRRLLETEPN